jgi:hypothetical protein
MFVEILIKTREMPTLLANPTPTSMWWSLDKAVNSSSKWETVKGKFPQILEMTKANAERKREEEMTLHLQC